MTAASARGSTLHPSVVAAGLVATALVFGAGGSPAAAQASSANEVTVTAVDYGFQAPDTLPPGPTLFRLANEGTVRHEVVLVRLREGKSADEFAERLRDPAADDGELVRGVDGILLADPDEEAGSRLLRNLVPGATYALVCTLKDDPDAQPHYELGMKATFQVAEGGG